MTALAAPCAPLHAPQERHRYIIEDVEWLASWGVSFDEIARRVGKAPVALERALYRWGRPDLARLAHGIR